MQDGRAGCFLEKLGIAQEFLVNILPTLEGVSRTAVRAPGLGRYPPHLWVFSRKEQSVATWKMECVHAAPQTQSILHSGKREMPLIKNSDRVRGFQVALPRACFVPWLIYQAHCGCRHREIATALIAPQPLEKASKIKKKKTQKFHAMSSQCGIAVSLLWLSLRLLHACFLHKTEQLSLTSTNASEKWISKLLPVLKESLFTTSQNYFCWEIISTRLITAQIYFWHRDCLSLGITLAPSVALREPLPPTINCNKLPRGCLICCACRMPAQSQSCPTWQHI